MHLTQDQEYLFQCALPNYNVYFENGTSNSAGVLTAVKQNCGIQIKLQFGQSGRFLSIICSWDSTLYKIMNIYAPNDVLECITFFEHLQVDLMDENILLCGDFNSVMSDSDHMSKRLDETSGFLNKLVRTHNLCEPQGFYQFMYQHPSQPQQQSRSGTIDHSALQILSNQQRSRQSVFLLSVSLQQKFKSCFHILHSDSTLPLEIFKKAKSII